MSSLSVEQLLLAIQKADSLEDLKKAIGPSESALEASKRRLSQLDDMWARALFLRWGDEPKNWPYPFNENYQRILQEQNDYENQYC